MSTSACATARVRRAPVQQLVMPSIPLPPNSSTRIAALDGLRGVAILLVLLRHALVGMQSTDPTVMKILCVGQLTWSGVDLFFVLSGFLIGGILLDARSSPRYYQTFYLRRAYRILPLYSVICGLFLLHHLPFRLLPGDIGGVSTLQIPWLSYATFTQNFWMARLGWYGQMAMAVTWSLAVEEQFYLTAPFFIRKLRERWLPLGLLLVIIGAPLLRLAIRSAFIHGDFACYVLMPCRADALSCGVLAAYLVRQPRLWKFILENRKAVWLGTGILLLGVVFMTYRQYEQFSGPMTTWGYSWFAMFYAGCLLLVISSPNGDKRRVLCNRGLMRMGKLAYCTYLLHFPLIGVGRSLLKVVLPVSPVSAWLVGGWLGVAASLALARISWEYFEQPMLRRGQVYRY